MKNATADLSTEKTGNVPLLVNLSPAMVFLKKKKLVSTVLKTLFTKGHLSVLLNVEMGSLISMKNVTFEQITENQDIPVQKTVN